MLSLQGGRFDHPNRLFHSIAQTWNNVLLDNVDLKEVSILYVRYAIVCSYRLNLYQQQSMNYLLSLQIELQIMYCIGTVSYTVCYTPHML